MKLEAMALYPLSFTFTLPFFLRSQFYLRRQAQRLQEPDSHPGHIDLPPPQTMTGRVLECVVIVVPALPVGKQGNPPAIRGAIAGVITAVTKQVRSTVYQPGTVEDCHNPNENTPYHKGPTAKVIEQKPQHDLNWDEGNIQKAVNWVAANITGEPGNFVSNWEFAKHPAHMTPPKALCRIMRILGLIGMNMVNSVHPNPVNGSAFTGKGATEHKKVLQEFGNLKAAMSHQAVKP